MDPIKDSPFKEAIRLRNLERAKENEQIIWRNLRNDTQRVLDETSMMLSNGLVKRKYPNGGYCVLFTVLPATTLFILLWWLPYSFCIPVVGQIPGLIVYIIWVCNVYDHNKKCKGTKENIEIDCDNEITRLNVEARQAVEKEYRDADKATWFAISQYDAAVKANCMRILERADMFTSMVDHTVSMLQRMISHADASSNIKFVEAELIYLVNMSGIGYMYQSRYYNPQNDFNFDKQRFRNLNQLEECEGLALALASMVINRINSMYPANSLNIGYTHIDAEVRIHYRAANGNYQPPRNIF